MSEKDPPAGEASEAFRDTLADLEWHRVLEAVAVRCRGPMRARLSNEPNTLPLASDPGTARAWLSELEEALRARREGEPLPLEGLPDVRPALARVVKLGVLDGPSLWALGRTLTAARTLRRFLALRKASLPRLYARCALDPGLDTLEEEIAACIEPGGTIADSASPELRRLRAEVAQLRARIVARLEQMLVEHETQMSDRFVTQREGRYVLPVRADAHDKVPGIVHGTSASGATVFVEPRSVVEQQNRLTLASAEIAREEHRILAQLSELVRERAESLEAALDALDLADLRDASARLAEDLRGHPARLVDAPVIRLRAARHPLLVLDGVEVVPNDLALEAGQALVLSGPNAGGKTVALKLLGLAALAARAGLPVAAAEDAEIGFFDPVISDVGDDQSLQKNLSTFSAHVRTVARTIALARRGALVLLDEVATGTDPGEGGALACAIVEALSARGAAVAVTTHYEALKAMARSDPRFRNASVGFDVRSMAPTFEVRMDVPGASSALAVAARFGLEASVIDRARALLPEQARAFEAMARELDEALARARAEAERLEAERRHLAHERDRLAEALARIKARDRSKLSEDAERLSALIRQARQDIQAARRAMRNAPTDAGLVDAARGAVERAAKHLAPDGAVGRAIANDAPIDRAQLDVERLVVGQRAWVPRLKAEVEIVEAPAKGRVRVAAGAVKLWVDVADLREPGPERTPDARATPPSVRRARAGGEPTAQSSCIERPNEPSSIPRRIATSDNTIDLRGLRVDEAVAMLDAFLDRMLGAAEPVAFVLHGIGTGALRDAVRAHLLERQPGVRAFRRGSIEEGGDRVTVVDLT